MLTTRGVSINEQDNGGVRLPIAVVSEGRIQVEPEVRSRNMSWTRMDAAETSFGILRHVFRADRGHPSLYYIPFNGRCEGLNLPEAIPAVFEFLKAQRCLVVFGVGYAGSLNRLLKPGDLVVPDDIIELTHNRVRSCLERRRPGIAYTFRSAQPFCPGPRRALYRASLNHCGGVGRVFDRSVFVCTEGPRFETAAEIRFYQSIGGDVVAFSAGTEAFVAREHGICYANLCVVSNLGEGMDGCRLDNLSSVSEPYRESILAKILLDAVEDIAQQTSSSQECPCRQFWIQSPVMRDDELEAATHDTR